MPRSIFFFRLCAQQRCSSEGFGDGLRGGSSRLVVVAVPWQARGGGAAAEHVAAGSRGVSWGAVPG